MGSFYSFYSIETEDREEMLGDALDDSGYSDEEDVDFHILPRNIIFEDIALFQDVFENDPGDNRLVFAFETSTPDPEATDEPNTSTEETDE